MITTGRINVNIKKTERVAYATKEQRLVQKPEETEDLRVRRTRKLLQKAFLELTVEKGFAALTVQDITERAMVNRSTFYRHYLDKYELLEQYMEEVYGLIKQEVSSNENWERTPDGAPPGLVILLKHIQMHSEFYRVMLGPKGDPVFTQGFRKNVENRFRYLISTLGAVADPKLPPLDLRVNYISYADIGAILWWLENDQPCTAEQFAIWLSQLTTASAGFSLKRD
jgi:AcrR family transcriptional regulator